MADLLVIGNPLLDISTNVTEEYLQKYYFYFLFYFLLLLNECLNRYDVKLNNAILAEDKHMPMYIFYLLGTYTYDICQL
jgi:adenosine kinase